MDKNILQNNPLVTFTDFAIDHFENFLSRSECQSIEIGVNNKGCSGLSYFIRPVNKKIEDSYVLICRNIKFYIKNESLKYIRGLRIDYVSTGIGSYKLLYENPNEKSQCGCGKSFSITN